MLFVSHHGSANATSTEFLERVDPGLVVISSDLGERHDHPNDEVLKNFYEHDVDVYWTAGHGTVRTDLTDTPSTDPTTDLDTTNPADLAALNHYCRDHEIDPETVGVLPPDLPEATPKWAIDGAPMVAEPYEQFVNEAIETPEPHEKNKPENGRGTRANTPARTSAVTGHPTGSVTSWVSHTVGSGHDCKTNRNRPYQSPPFHIGRALRRFDG